MESSRPHWCPEGLDATQIVKEALGTAWISAGKLLASWLVVHMCSPVGVQDADTCMRLDSPEAADTRDLLLREPAKAAPAPSVGRVNL